MQINEPESIDQDAPAAAPIDPELINWIEAQARSTVDFGIACSDALERQANTLINTLIVGAGGSFAYFVSLSEKKAVLWQQWGMFAVAIWLFLVAAIVLIKCMWSGHMYPPTNDPENMLAVKKYSLIEVKGFQLDHVQFAIKFNRARNNSVGLWLNGARALTILTPGAFAIGAWAACYWG